MEKFVVEYAEYKKQLIDTVRSYSDIEKKDAFRKIDKVLELCFCGFISNECAIRIISEV